MLSKGVVPIYVFQPTNLFFLALVRMFALRLNPNNHMWTP